MSINDRIQSGDDRVRTINNQDALGHDRIRLGNHDLQYGNNRFVPINNRFRYGNDYFLRAVRNSLIRWVLMSAANNRFRYGNCYLHVGDGYLRSEDDRRCSINNRVRLSDGSLQHDNDRGCCANNRLRAKKDRLVDRVDRRPNGNTCFAIVNHYRRREDDRQRSGVDRDNGSVRREDGREGGRCV